MPSFADPVSSPSTRDYAAPQVDFSILGNLYKTYQESGLTEQEKQLRAVALQRQQQELQQQQQLRTLFQGGLPMQNGQLDYQAITQALAKAGDINAISTLYPAVQGQAAGQVSPMLTGGTATPGTPATAAPAPGARSPTPGDIPPSATAPTRTTPAYTGGDSGSGTVASIVAGKYGDASPETGRLMSRIGMTMGVDPNAPLSAGQQRRAQGLLERYGATDGAAPQITAPVPIPRPAPGPPGGTETPNTRVASTFADVPIPAVSAAPPAAVTTPPAPAPTVPPAPSAQPAPAVPGAPSPVAAGVPGQPQGQVQQPIIPQVPLPKGYSDPQTAIQALRTEAARMSANPYAAGQVKALNDWATRIETAQQPLTVQPGQRIVSPTGQTLYSAPERPVSVGGQLVRPDTGEVVFKPEGNLQGRALESAAINWLQTGKYPVGIGRGVQGSADRNAIQARGTQLADDRGIDLNTLPSRWQTFQAQATGKRSLENRAANLTLVESETRTLIPRVRDISDKIDRTQYPDLNSLILASKRKTGGEDVIRLGIAVESLIPVYARLLKPVGQVGVADTATAHSILNAAWSKGQIRAALDQMEIERQAAHDALREARREYAEQGNPEGPLQDAAVGAKGGSGQPVTKWEKGADGVLRPAATP